TGGARHAVAPPARVLLTRGRSRERAEGCRGGGRHRRDRGRRSGDRGEARPRRATSSKVRGVSRAAARGGREAQAEAEGDAGGQGDHARHAPPVTPGPGFSAFILCSDSTTVFWLS